MDESNEVLGDIIARLIEGDMLSGEQWRPAACLDFLVQTLTMTADDDSLSTEVREHAQEISAEILLNLTYLKIYSPEDEESEIEQDVLKFREILGRVDREDKHNEEDADG
jgi:hypothetical protein